MERFEYVTSLGEGAYGTVWLCLNRDTKQKVAMKRFKDAHTDPEVMRLALREIRLLKASQHKNVVQLLEAFRSKSGRVYIVMEHVERTLTQDLRKFNRGFPPLLVKMITWQLLQAVSFLHKNRIIHRDLKPANILLTSDNVVKLCDFGFARTMHPQETADYTTYVVTRWYRPPEVLVSDEYGPKVDVWAIGCLFSEMASGRPLFPGKTSADQLWLTVRTLGNLPPRQAALMAQDPLYTNYVAPTSAERTSLEQRYPQFTPEMLHLLYGCLALDPEQRMSADEALAAPYFADVPQIIAAMEASHAAGQDFWGMVEAAWRASLAAAAQVTKQQSMPMPSHHAVERAHAPVAISTSQTMHLNSLLSPDGGMQPPCSAGSTTSRVTAPLAPLANHLQRQAAANSILMTRPSLDTCQLARYSSTGFSDTTTLTVMSGSSLQWGHSTVGNGHATGLHSGVHRPPHMAHEASANLSDVTEGGQQRLRTQLSRKTTANDVDSSGNAVNASACSNTTAPVIMYGGNVSSQHGLSGSLQRSRLSITMPTIASASQAQLLAASSGLQGTSSRLQPLRASTANTDVDTPTTQASSSHAALTTIPMNTDCDVYAYDKSTYHVVPTSSHANDTAAMSSTSPSQQAKLSGSAGSPHAPDAVVSVNDGSASTSGHPAKHHSHPQQCVAGGPVRTVAMARTSNDSHPHRAQSVRKQSFFKELSNKLEGLFTRKERGTGASLAGLPPGSASGRATRSTLLQSAGSQQGALPAIADTAESGASKGAPSSQWVGSVGSAGPATAASPAPVELPNSSSNPTPGTLGEIPSNVIVRSLSSRQMQTVLAPPDRAVRVA
mmetsp:Transcript_3059/g.7658  ORF Transcript_3059/g.7658 Transcript_3059/m.7658 type:complete len:835 (-) Transcript_3059:1890-4394(-)|eukprot:CAMPEP_0202867366 /NCGR_PEP_ID=MMETSP1391-20130828/9264_1 /ASSEMBLY_ACC=CAM_ASM_000867 /TAXON_ID=1034604 /ORGANISM="Chlamydomonas leiostraca, Strain SAG 11-49" /LENGTH=834 /DNA_ID=CAMNT_0049547407 /DNA_START=140 /DNA_END=2644 /DNA_ORIENTATION=+